MSKVLIYNELVRAQLENASANLTPVAPGLIYLNTTANEARFYNGSAWKTFLNADFSNVTGTLPVANGGTGATAATGTGNVVLQTSPTLTTPNLGTPSAITLTSGTGLPIDGGTINTLPIGRGGTGQTNANAALNALLPTQSPSTTANTVLGSDGTNAAWVSGSSGGSGEINAILNPNAASNTTGATAGTGHTVTRITSGSPLAPIITTAYRISNSATAALSNTSGVYWTFTLPDTLENRKLKVQFYCNVPSTNVWNLRVYDGTTKISLDTDASGETILPAGFVGTFTTSFQSTSNNSYSVNITGTTGTGTNLDVTNIIVGPGITAQGAAVDQEISYTPVLTGMGTIVTGVNTATWQRVGDSMRVRGFFTYSSGTGNSDGVTVSLPPGRTIDSSKLPVSFTTRGVIGTWQWYDDSGSATVEDDNFGGVNVNTSSTVLFRVPQTSNNFISSVLAANDTFQYQFWVPIAEWAGSGTVNLAQNDVEYAFNSSLTTTDDTTSFGYGLAGAAIQAFAPAATGAVQKRVRFLTPFQQGEFPLVIIQGANGTWFTSESIVPFVSLFDGTTHRSVGLRPFLVSGSSTDVDVFFYSGATKISGSAGVNTWSAFASDYPRWAVVKAKSGQAVGFGAATATQSGLVRGGTVPGQVSGAAIASGFLGQVLYTSAAGTGGSISNNSASVVTIAATNINFEVGRVSLPAGVWDVSAIVLMDLGAGGAWTSCQAWINTSVGASIASNSEAMNWSWISFPLVNNGASRGTSQSLKPRRFNLSTTTDIFLVARAEYATLGTGSNASGQLMAVRVG